MCDRDPVPRWTQGRVTLLGDAAHQIAPVGPDAASETILDALALAEALATVRDADAGGAVTDGLAAYEERRCKDTAAVLLARRAGGTEKVIDHLEQLAPDGFTDIDAVMSYQARADFVAAMRAVRVPSVVVAAEASPSSDNSRTSGETPASSGVADAVEAAPTERPPEV